MILQLAGRVLLIAAAALIALALVGLFGYGWWLIFSITDDSPLGWGGRVSLSAFLLAVIGAALEGAGRLAKWHKGRPQ